MEDSIFDDKTYDKQDDIEDSQDTDAEQDPHTARIEKITKEEKEIKAQMKELTKKFSHPRDVGKHMHRFYDYRGKLIELKKTYRRIASANSTERAVAMNDMVKSIKSGTRVGDFQGDISMIPKNDKDREIMYNANMSDMDNRHAMVTIHLEFIIDQISTIDKMVFNFETIIKFYDKYVS